MKNVLAALQEVENDGLRLAVSPLMLCLSKGLTSRFLTMARAQEVNYHAR